jgi:2,3-bisphosphoglycerate-dependent phosphoglycerate mutase
MSCDLKVKLDILANFTYVRPPGGESLEDTQQRVFAYFNSRILPHLLAGDNVLIAAHGNSLRSIIMMLDGLSPDEVTTLELATGVPIVYELDAAGGSIAGADGKPFGKKILNSN